MSLLLTAYWRNGLLHLGARESVEHYEGSGHPKGATIDNKKSVESDVAPVGIKSYKFLFVEKKIYFAVFKELMG